MVAAAGCGDSRPGTDARDSAGDKANDGSSNDRMDAGGGDRADTSGTGGSTGGAGGDTGGNGGSGGSGGSTGGTGGVGGTGGSAGNGGSLGNDGSAGTGVDGGLDGAAPTCTDGIKNSDETGIDCGGHCGKCAPGGGCLVNADCQFACRADKTCAACNVAADCSGAESECVHRTCTAGVCGSTMDAAGTVLTVQVAGDCKRRQCAANGTVTNANDDTDVPDDRNPCTNDICTSGVASHTMMPANSNCGGANHCNATGQCIGCSVASDCPGTDTPCRTRTCTTGGVCGFSFAAAGTKLVDPTAGDCKGLQCDGNGNDQVVNTDADLPVDNNVCTTDECTAGTPSHRPIASGTACGGSLVCDGASHCVECLSASTCPGTDAECHTRSCVSGQCGVTNIATGTLVAAQTPRDCKKNVCNGQGGVVTVNDDLDLPVDSNACTFDVCTAGTPSNPNVPAGNSCGASTICDGQGACVTCLTASSCPGTDTECHHRTCTNGVCGIANTTAGTPLAVQVAGDCKRNQCDGNGAPVVVNDDADKPVDGNTCTDDVCTAGVPSNPNVAQGTTCGPSLMCNGQGACVGCVTAANCGTDTFCQAHTCSSAGVCGVTNTPAGTAVPNQIAGDCKKIQCDGQGQQVTVNDDTDKLVDNNACTMDLCSGGIASNPPEAAGTACNQNNGSRCNGSGTAPACVQCLQPTDCPGTDTECHHRTCSAAGVCGIANTADGTLVQTQAAGDCKKNICMGGAQVTVNDDLDVLVDNNGCTMDLCNNGTPANPPLPANSACSENGGTRCNGSVTAPACVQCLQPSHCGTNSICQSFSCSAAGQCITNNVAQGTATSNQAAGDCKKNVCNGLGAEVAVADDTDVFVDGNGCTADQCNNGVPSNPSLPANTACNENNGTRCNGSASAPACVQCLQPSHCGTDTDCQSFSCTGAGLCVTNNAAQGTATSTQTTGDCKKNVCNGTGSSVSMNDNTDVFVDGNECTSDVCMNGTPMNPFLTAGTSCGTPGGTTQMCDGQGSCVGCLTAADCPAPPNACQITVCMTGGVCGFTNKPQGTLVTNEPAGDCHHDECGANGNVVTVVDDNDKPSTGGNQCLQSVCTNGTPTNPPFGQGVACSQSNGTECDGAGHCVQCVNASECPGGPDTECHSRTCTNGTCGIALANAGTAVSTQVSHDCQKNVCDSDGNIVSMADDSDLPDNNGNDCITPMCVAGVPMLPSKTLGTLCSPSPGFRCDATPACVATFMDVRLGDGSAALTNAGTAVFIEERFESDGSVYRTIPVPSAAGSPKPLVLSGTADGDGALVLSGDGHYVTLAGYNAAAGTANVASTASATVPRIAASINLAGTVDTSTTFGTAFNNNNVRSAASNDGTQFWMAGNCNGSGCVRGVNYATDGATTSVNVESTTNSTRVCVIAFGGLYCDAASGSLGVFKVGTGLPTTAGTTTTSLTGTTSDTNASYYGLALFDLVAGGDSPDTMYVADDRAPASGGGIQKWTSSGGTWTLVGTFNNTLTLGVRGLAAHTDGSNVVLIATTAINSPNPNANSNAIVKFIDNGSAPSTIVPTTLQAAANGANKVYRGVSVSAH